MLPYIINRELERVLSRVELPNTMMDVSLRLIILGLKEGEGKVICVRALKLESNNISELVTDHVDPPPHIVNIILKLMKEWLVGLRGARTMIIVWRSRKEWSGIRGSEWNVVSA